MPEPDLEKLQTNLEKSHERVVELEATVAALETEKTKLVAKRDDLIVKLAKLKNFEKYEELDIEELIEFKDNAERNLLKEKGKYDELYQRDKQKLEAEKDELRRKEEERQAEREREKQEIVQMKIDSAAMAIYAKKDVIAPDQLLALTRSKLKLNEQGDPIAVEGYRETPLEDYTQELKDNPGYQHHFKSSGATGSGGRPNLGQSGDGLVNPWRKETWNLTQQGQIFKSNPQRADALKAQAGG